MAAHAENQDTWRIVSSVVRGPNHEHADKDCDDACQYMTANGWLVAVVCDGAGGAAAGGQGAKLTAELVAKALIARVSGRTPFDRIESLVKATLTHTHSELITYAQIEQLSLPDLSTTLVGAVLRGGRGLLFHIGDGLALAFAKDGSVVGRSDGTPKEYANEPCFLTDIDWQSHLMLGGVRGMTEVLLMTDGVSPFALRRESLNQAFISHVRARARYGTEAQGSEALREMLDHPRAREEVGDDKTLLWAEMSIQADRR